MKRRNRISSQAGRPSRPRNLHARSELLRKSGYHRSEQTRRELRDNEFLQTQIDDTQVELGEWDEFEFDPPSSTPIHLAEVV